MDVSEVLDLFTEPHNLWLLTAIYLCVQFSDLLVHKGVIQLTAIDECLHWLKGKSWSISTSKLSSNSLLTHMLNMLFLAVMS